MSAFRQTSNLEVWYCHGFVSCWGSRCQYMPLLYVCTKLLLLTCHKSIHILVRTISSAKATIQIQEAMDNFVFPTSIKMRSTLRTAPSHYWKLEWRQRYWGLRRRRRCLTLLFFHAESNKVTFDLIGGPVLDFDTRL